MKTKSIVTLGTALALLAAVLPSHANELKVGDVAPDFKLPGSDGKTYQLADFKGKQAVVIAWFPKAFTGGCTKQCTSMKADGALIRNYDVAYFTASVDPMEGEKGNKAFAESLGADYPILSDESKATARAYGVVTDQRALPQRWTFFIGKDGKILHIDKQVDVDDYGKSVAAKLKELGVAGKK